jgi:Uma2 family endonuclease
MPFSTTLNPFQMPPFPVWRFSVDDYHRLIELGAFTEDDPVELLEGWLVPKMPRNPPHDGCIQCTNKAVSKVLPAGWTIRIQSALTTTDSEPEPDVAVVRGNERTYFQYHPRPVDVGLLVEVSDTTLLSDRNEKGRIYARAGVPSYWIVNLADQKVEVYTDPTGPDASPRYRQHQDYLPSQDIPLILDGQQIALISARDLLP